MVGSGKAGRVFSRREILKGAPLVILASTVLGGLSASPVLSRLIRGRRPPTFPKGSIFTPAKNQTKNKA